MSAVRERRTTPMNGAARLALVLCVASALSIAVDAATYSYVGNCDDIASHTGSSSQKTSSASSSRPARMAIDSGQA